MAKLGRFIAVSALLIALMAIPTTLADQPVRDYQQCGGESGECSQFRGCKDGPWDYYFCDNANSKCERNNQWHWQCNPSGAPQGGSSGSSQQGSQGGASSGGAQTLPAWSQCGGKGSECNKFGHCADAPFRTGYACPSGYFCTRESEWYWQCRPQSSRSASSSAEMFDDETSSGSRSAGGSVKTLNVWDQCGGLAANGRDCGSGGCVDAPYSAYTCPSGTSCVRQDPHYWQCKPGSNGGNNGGNNGGSNGGNNGGMQTLPQWGQCGGKSGECNKYGHCADAPFRTGYTCPSGYSCTKETEWYWQCRPTPGGSRSAASSSSDGDDEPSSTRVGSHLKSFLIGDWQQCGGKGGETCKKYSMCGDMPYIKGFYCANPSYSCQRVDEWYWQCKPLSGNNNNNQNGNSKQIDVWQQCGGKGGDCNKFGGCSDAAFRGASCSGGNSCKRMDEWYWQCQPGGGGNQNNNNQNQNSQNGNTNSAGMTILGPWGQCGGKGGDCNKFGHCADAPFRTGYTCPSGYSCAKDNEWFWQCRPSGNTRSSSAGAEDSDMDAEDSGTTRSGAAGGRPVSVADYQQCGGKGGSCSDYRHCADAAWPFATCSNSKFACKRITEWHWQCEQGSGSTDSKPATNTDTKPSTNTNNGGNTNINTQTSGGNAKPIADYQQCGGKGGSCNDFKSCTDTAWPSVKCANPSFACLRITEWHWQCEQSKDSKPSTNTNTGGNTGGNTNTGGNESKPSGGGSVLAKWQQCGGKGGDCSKWSCVDGPFPGTSCPAGSSCQKETQWYYQCR